MSKVDAVIELLESLTPMDFAMCTRGELNRLSDAAFDCSGDCELELESRGAATNSRQELVPH